MHRIAYLVAPEFQVMSFAALSAFELANLMCGAPQYEVRVLSEHGGAVRSSIGTSINTHPYGRTLYDTVIAGGSIHP